MNVETWADLSTTAFSVAFFAYLVGMVAAFHFLAFRKTPVWVVSIIATSIGLTAHLVSIVARGAAALDRWGVVSSKQQVGAYGALLAGGEQLHRFATRLLKPLTDYDERHGSALVATLAAYLDAAGSPTATARVLNLHINSLYYRLQRISELGRFDLDDPEVRFELQLALRVMRTAADTLKRVHLELGGKAPVVVFDDADLEAVASTLTEAGYYNSGQDCTAPCRVLAGERVFDSLVGDLSSKVGALAVGDPLDEATEVGPVVSGDQQQRVAGLVDRARDGGAVKHSS